MHLTYQQWGLLVKSTRIWSFRTVNLDFTKGKIELSMDLWLRALSLTSMAHLGATPLQSYSRECSYGCIQWFQSKILLLFLPYFPSTSTNINPRLFGKRNKLFIKMTLSIVSKKKKNLKLNYKSYKEMFMKPLLRGSVPNERKTITSERRIKASNLYTSFQSTD